MFDPNRKAQFAYHDAIAVAKKRSHSGCGGRRMFTTARSIQCAIVQTKLAKHFNSW